MASPSRAAFGAALLVVYLLWGSTYLAMRWVVEAIPPFTGAAIRFLVAGAFLYAFMRMRGAPRPTRAQWGASVIVGGLLLLGGNGGVMWAEQWVTSGFAALMIATVPLVMVLGDPFLGGTRPSVPVLLALAGGFAGVAFLVWDRIAWQDAHVGGVLVLLVAATSWAIGSLLSRRLPRPRRSLQGAAMQMLSGGLLLVVAAVLAGESARFHPAQVPLRSWWSLLYLILFGSLVAYTCYMWLLQNGTPTVVGTYAYVNPVVAVALGALLAREVLTVPTVIGGSLVLLSVAVINLLKERPADPRRAVAAAEPPLAEDHQDAVSGTAAGSPAPRARS